MTLHQSREFRREQVLESALKLFITRGYEDSTVDDISHNAGLSKGSIYWYFKSKLDILLELTDRYVRDSQAQIVKLAAADKYGTQAMYKAHRDMNMAAGKDSDMQKLLSQLMGLTARYPEIRERMRDYYRQWDNVTTELIDKDVAAGKLAPVDGRVLSQAIIAMYDGLCLRQQIDPDVNVVKVIETIMKLVHDNLAEHSLLGSAVTAGETA